MHALCKSCSNQQRVIAAFGNRSWGGSGKPSKSAQARSQSRPDPLAGVEQRSKSARAKAQPKSLRGTTAWVQEDPDAEVDMDFGNATDDLGSMDSLYEPNIDSMSNAAGNDGTQAEDPTVAEAAEDEVDDTIFHKCTTGTANAITQTNDGGIEVIGDLLEHLLQAGYTENLQSELYEILRQHQPHETFPPCTTCHGALMHVRQPCRSDSQCAMAAVNDTGNCHDCRLSLAECHRSACRELTRVVIGILQALWTTAEVAQDPGFYW